MSDWKQYLTQGEIGRLSELAAIRDSAIAERKRIWDRCRKRKAKALA